jgi:spermidine synthase
VNEHEQLLEFAQRFSAGLDNASREADEKMSSADKYKVDIPTGTSGDFTIEHFEVTKADTQFEMLRATANGHVRFATPGRYTRLMRGRTLVMSDTPDEIRDHRHFIHTSYGRVLIHGLGIGMVARACLLKQAVKDVTVVEISEDVIKLVGPWLEKIAEHSGKTLRIVQDDAYTWKPKKGERWDVVWHDLWDTMCTDNLPLMHKLHRRFGRRCTSQGSWSRETLERLKREEERNGFWR